MAIKIYVKKKTHTVTGNPNYTLFIPGVYGKIKGLRQHKKGFEYGIISYNLKQELQNYVFKGQYIEVYDKYGDRL